MAAPDQAATGPAEPAAAPVELRISRAEYDELKRAQDELAALKRAARAWLMATADADLARAEMSRLAYRP